VLPSNPSKGLLLKVKLQTSIKLTNDCLVPVIPECNHLPKFNGLEHLGDLCHMLEALDPSPINRLGLMYMPRVEVAPEGSCR
jgi:hypothetical protein